MGSGTRKLRSALSDKDSGSSVLEETLDEHLAEAAETVSFKAISLEERRKEAGKPLFLTRYE
jgi:hypothetical protein